MINDRDTITKEFNDRFRDLDEKYKENADKMGLSLNRIPYVSTSDGFFKKVTSFFGGTDTITLTADNGTNLLQRALAQSLIPPYSIKFSTTMSSFPQRYFVGTAGLTGVYYSPSNIENYDDKVVAYSYSGVRIANGTAGIFAASIPLSSPKLISNNDIVSSEIRTYGFRELSYGNLELYDYKTDNWYPVNNSFMGNTSRQIYARLGSTRTYTFNIVL